MINSLKVALLQQDNDFAVGHHVEGGRTTINVTRATIVKPISIMTHFQAITQQ